MPYQNNNNRLTPQAYGRKGITPEAQVLNQEVRYKFDDSKAQQTLLLTQGLADLGRGLISVVDVEQKKQAESAIQMIYNDNLEGKNRHDYQAALKRDKSGTLAKYNPYLKESYKDLAAKDFMEQAIYNLYKDPNYDSLSPQEAYQVRENAREGFRKTLLDNGIETQFAAKYLEDFHEKTNQWFGSYLAKSAERNYNLSANAIQYNASTGLTARLYNCSMENQGAEISSALSSLYEAHGRDMPIEDFISKITLPAVYGTIKRYDGIIDNEQVIRALKEIKFDGKSIGEIVPDYEERVRTSLKEIENQKYEEENREYLRKQREDALKNKEAQREFMQYIINNPDENFVEKAQEIVTNYGIEENYNSFLNDIKNNAALLEAIQNKDIEANEELLKALDLKAGLGTLEAGEVYEAYKNGLIDRKNFYGFMDMVNKREEAEQKQKLKASEAGYKAKFSEGLKFGAANKKELEKRKTDNGNKYTDFAESLAAINSLVQAGDITHAEGQGRIDALMKQVKKVQDSKSDIPEFYNGSQLMSRDYLTKIPDLMVNPSYDDSTAADALRDMGNLDFYDYKDKISSGIRPSRTINGVTKAHNGIDFKIPEGTPVLMNKHSSGTVISKGYSPTAGNYILIRIDKTGDYQRFLHLSKYSPLKIGQKVRPSQYVGLSGNTGYSTGAHLHTDFFDKNGLRAYPEDAAARLTGKKYKKKNKR